LHFQFVQTGGTGLPKGKNQKLEERMKKIFVDDGSSEVCTRFFHWYHFFLFSSGISGCRTIDSISSSLRLIDQLSDDLVASLATRFVFIL
jgi:hypothetical protein